MTAPRSPAQRANRMVARVGLFLGAFLCAGLLIHLAEAMVR